MGSGAVGRQVVWEGRWLVGAPAEGPECWDKGAGEGVRCGRRQAGPAHRGSQRPRAGLWAALFGRGKPPRGRAVELAVHGAPETLEKLRGFGKHFVLGMVHGVLR